MKIGVVFPQTEFPSDPIAIRDYAQTVEGLGFSHILAYDHILGANPDRPGGWTGIYTCHDSFQEPLTMFAYMAAVTQKLEFATGVIILPQRQTAVFAKQAATLDILCSGRLRLGVGIGWNPVEFVALNENFHNRGKRIEEQVILLRQFFTQPLVTFTGKWHTIPDAGLNPLPLQHPIPIWFGGDADAVLERMARLGDGWMPRYRRVTDAQPALDKIQQLLEANGRDTKEFGIEFRMPYGNGNPDEWSVILGEWEKAGATHMSIITMGAGFDTLDKQLEALLKFAKMIH